MQVTRVGVMVVVAVAGGDGVNTAFAFVVAGGAGVFGVCALLFSFPLLLLRQIPLKILPKFRTATYTVGACYLKFKLQAVVPGIT